MRTPVRKFLTGLAVTLAMSVSAWAQTTAIAGDVKGVDGKPAVGVQIKIDRTDMKGAYKVKTDKKGHYYYGGLGMGTYTVTVEVNGKDVDQVKGVRTTTAKDAEISFDLKAAADRAAGAAAAPAEEERGMSAAQKAEYEKKKKEQEAAMAKNKELNDAFNAGMEAEKAKSWDVAIQQFDKATQLDPKQHVVWSHMADAYIARGDGKNGADQQADYSKGVEAYQKALEVAPQDAAYHNNYALVLAKAKKLEQAQAELTKAAELDPPQGGKYYYNLGAVLVNTGQSDPAGTAFRKAIELDPNYAEAYYQLGLVLLGKATTTPEGKIVPPEGTADAFQKYLSLAPTGPNAEPAKQMLTSLGSSIETNFERPGQKKQAPNTKKK
jgi:tetratricopeptide (TPR) repeat protein